MVSKYLKLRVPTTTPIVAPGIIINRLFLSHVLRNTQIAKQSAIQILGSNNAAACGTDTTKAINGVARLPVPPIPALEIPIVITAGIATK